MKRFGKYRFLCTGIYKFWITRFAILWETFLERDKQTWKRWNRINTTHVNLTINILLFAKVDQKRETFSLPFFGSALLWDTISWKIRLMTLLLMTLLTYICHISDDCDKNFKVCVTKRIQVRGCHASSKIVTSHVLNFS